MFALLCGLRAMVSAEEILWNGSKQDLNGDGRLFAGRNRRHEQSSTVLREFAEPDEAVDAAPGIVRIATRARTRQGGTRVRAHSLASSAGATEAASPSVPRWRPHRPLGYAGSQTGRDGVEEF